MLGSELPPRCRDNCPLSPEDLQKVPVGRKCQGPVLSNGEITQETVVLGPGEITQVKPEVSETTDEYVCRNEVFGRYVKEVAKQNSI